MRNDYKRLGDYIRLVDVRNRELLVTKLLGVSISKEFMPSIANTIGTDMSAYKIVKQGQFAYGPVTSRNGDKVSIALLETEDEAIISQAYTVFDVIDKQKLIPEYLMMWFCRTEFDRYARFHSHGSAREVFDWDEMCNVILPIPSLERQQEIVEEYETLTRRIRLNEQMISKLEETAQTIYRKMFVNGINQKMYMADNVLVIRSKNYEYCYQILNSLDYFEITKGGVQSLITQTDLKGCSVLLPPKELLDLFEQQAMSIFTLAGIQKEYNENLTELQSLLLAKMGQ